MKILIIGLNYYPELTGIGKYTGEMAEWLAKQGHDIRVICAPPYYPQWQIDAAYLPNRYRCESANGVVVFRIPLWVPRKPSGLSRIIHLLSFSFLALPKMFAQVRWRPDVVWMVEPPIASAPFVLLLGRITKAKTWLHIQDFEVDAAFGLGLVKSAKLRKFIERGESWIMRKFDVVSSISSKMLARLSAKGVQEHVIRGFPNWADISNICPLGRPSKFRELYKIKPETVVALYSGNMGKKQGLETLAGAARLLAADDRVFFVFCGQGAGREDFEDQCKDLTNVLFLDLQPVDLLNELLGLADIHLLPQRGDAADLVMPSKLTGMLASGRCVIAGATSSSELGRVVMQDARCGLIVNPDDAPALASAVIELAGSAELRESMGKLGREFAEQHLSRDGILTRFNEDLQNLIK